MLLLVGRHSTLRKSSLVPQGVRRKACAIFSSKGVRCFRLENDRTGRGCQGVLPTKRELVLGVIDRGITAADSNGVGDELHDVLFLERGHLREVKDKPVVQTQGQTVIALS